MSHLITPVLLAGGSGTRLWPLSRRSYPKQFSKLIGTTSLFQQSASRVVSSQVTKFSPPITLTNSDFRFIAAEQLQKIGIDPGPIIIEPEGKNTGPAVLAACLFAQKHDETAILLVAPSDHVISDVSAFHRALQQGFGPVNDGKIVTFGIEPTRASTSYGYLELPPDFDNNGATSLRGFVEKPSELDAASMVESGNFLWNAGIFMFRAIDMITAFKKYAPTLLQPVIKAVEEGKPDLGFFRLETEAWKKCENISVDYAVMEQSQNLVVIPFTNGWSDLGGWDAVWEEMGPDKNGVAISKNAHAIECEDTLLRSETETLELVGVGLKGILAVAMPDAVLIAKKGDTKSIKMVVDMLKSKKVKQAEILPKDYRPWGWFETLAFRGRFQVKRILVNPGAALSLQSHHHRSEHWVIVEGTAKVTINGKERLVTEGESVYIPLGAVHRLENPGKVSMILIEIQTGTYLHEDDIIRYEDLYSRDKQVGV